MLPLQLSPLLDGPCGLADTVDRSAEFAEDAGRGVAGDDQLLQRLQLVRGRFQPLRDGVGTALIFAGIFDG